MSEETEKRKERKTAKRRRNLPRAPPSTLGNRDDSGRKSIDETPRKKAEDLKRLPQNVLQQLQDVENSLIFMPGQIEDIDGSEIAEPGDKISTITLKSGKKVQITMKEGSFRRITGLREHIDASGSYIIRRVEIKKEPGKSLGFYIREGDGWFRKDGIFVSRINLGSIVDVNRLLNVGDEITRINDVNVTSMPLDDVVLIMQYVQKMILTVKVLRGVADTLHNLKTRERKRRELPRTPSHLERGKVMQVKSTNITRDDDDLLPLKGGELDLKTDRNMFDAMHSAHIPEAAPTNGFHSIAEPVMIQADVHPYEGVDFVTDKENSFMENVKQPASNPSPQGSQPLLGAKETVQEDIAPYRKIQILGHDGKTNALDHQRQSSAGQSQEDDNISPYAQVSSELKAKLARKKESELQVASSSNTVSVGDLISPYSEIKRHSHIDGSSKPPDSSTHSASDMSGEDKNAPYANVSKEFKVQLRKKKEKKLQGPPKPEDHGSEVSQQPSEGSPPEDASEHKSQGRLSMMLCDSTLERNQMDLGGLLDIIKMAQFVPRSPVVRRSFILEEPETTEPVVDPSHIYAQLDHDRQKSLNDDKHSEHRTFSDQPPSPPKSPVPLDPDEMETLPSILHFEDQSIPDHDAVEEEEIRITFSGVSKISAEDVHVSGDDRSSTLLQQREIMDLALTEALAELDDQDTEPPPLPPPYVPDEGPPESSDSEDEHQKEWKSKTWENEDGQPLKNQVANKSIGDHHENEELLQLTDHSEDDLTNSLSTTPDKIPSDPLSKESPHGRAYPHYINIPEIFVSPPPPESPGDVGESELKMISSEEKCMKEQEPSLSNNSDNLDDAKEEQYVADTSVDSLEQFPSVPPAPPDLPPPELPATDLPPEIPPTSPPQTLFNETSTESSPPKLLPPQHPPSDPSPEEQTSGNSTPTNSLPPSPPTTSSHQSSPPSPPTLLPELPPPPPPPAMAPPEDLADDDNNDDDRKSQNSDISSSSGSFVRLPMLQIQDIGTSSPSDKRFSGTLVVTITGLNISSKKSTNFWSTNALQKMIFILSIDNCTKINTTLPPGMHHKSADMDELEGYNVMLLQNFHVKFSLHSICLPHISKCTKLVDIFPSQQESARNIRIGFEHYGDLQLSVHYRPMNSTVARLNPQGTPHQASFSDYVLFNNASGYPLILERGIKAVEKFGLKTAHLYDRCAPNLNKKRALASCMEDLDNQSLKQAVIKCSVHAFTGIIVDFFCELPEPFFTNKLSSELTQAASASRDPKVLDQFLEQLPKSEMKTLRLLLSHFKTVCQHGSKNGVSVKVLSRLFGPLLLIPSLSPDMYTNQSLSEFAEDHYSQSRVLELLLSRDPL